MDLQESGTGWILIFVFFLEVVFIFFLITPGDAAQARKEERISTVEMLGEAKAREATRFANKWFGAHFIDTGIVSKTQSMAIPSDESRRKAVGLENFLPEVFGWVQKRLEGFWSMLYGAYHRVYVLKELFYFCLPLLIPALMDGLMERKISVETQGVANAVFYHGAKKALFVLAISPLFIAFLPFTISTNIWYAWFLLVPLVVWVTAKNVQES